MAVTVENSAIENSADPVDLLAPDLVADPFGGYARMREHAPVLTGTIMGGPPMWLVTRYEDVRRVLTDPRFLSDPAAAAPGGPDIREAVLNRMNIPEDLIGYLGNKLSVSDGAEHARLRSLVSRGLTARRVSALRPRVEEITAALLDQVAAAGGDGSPVDLVEALCYPLPITVICELVGIDEADRPRFRDWGRALSTMDAERLPTALRGCVELVREVIGRRRAEPRDDLVTALVQAQREDGARVADHEMISLILSLVTAGHQTTTYLLGNSVLALMERPDQLAMLRADPSLWAHAVHEFMRLGPTQFGQPRYPCEDVELGGVTIPAGAPVAPLILAANTDPRRFGDPDRLDVCRAPGSSESHLGFGQGAHYCLGAPLASQETEVGLHALFTRFPGLSLAVPRAQIPWTLRPGFTRVAQLPVRLG